MMVEDTDRLLGHHRAGAAGRTPGRAGPPRQPRRRSTSPLIVQDCLALARTRHHLPEDALTYRESLADGSAPRVLGDEDELKAVVSNLVDNAIKYSGSQVQVAVELEQPDDTQATLRVRDEGVGISAVELKRIFKRFYRIPGAVAVRVKGTGLGLFIVRSRDQAARRQGLRRERRPRPRQHVHGAAADHARAPSMSRILVVEDEQHLAEGLRFNLVAEQSRRRGGRHGRSGAGAAGRAIRRASTW